MDGEPVTITSPMQGTVVSVDASVGDTVTTGRTVVIVESMKMEHPVEATTSGSVTGVLGARGDPVQGGDVVARLDPVDPRPATAELTDPPVDLGGIRPDLQDVVERHAVGLDERRPDA